ncbi:hypothetical protein [Halomonas korlensis]|uniref:PAS fold-containing protein n=1 Tax=Halomonas korlensis TaxID=463301 RepID=A0A1I7GS40_9GAMM|nr:hypothetical protein [Halomonas korlensis]SFU51257.1 PAS fold-containing protein [Halomonas korlensis]
MPTASPSTRSPVSATQPSGCVLILDTDASRVLQTSANLPEILGVPVDAALAEGPGHVLGHDLAGHAVCNSMPGAAASGYWSRSSR